MARRLNANLALPHLAPSCYPVLAHSPSWDASRGRVSLWFLLPAALGCELHKGVSFVTSRMAFVMLDTVSKGIRANGRENRKRFMAFWCRSFKRIG